MLNHILMTCILVARSSSTYMCTGNFWKTWILPGHAVTDPAPSDEELSDSHLPQWSVPSTSPSMTEQESFSSAATTQPLNCTLVTADILCTRSGSPHNDLHSLV